MDINTKTLVDSGCRRLERAGNGNPKRSVEELAAHVLGCKPLEIYWKELSAAQKAGLEKSIARAERGEPIQYIIGSVDFRGLNIGCDPRALIPRPETEVLVETVLSKLTDRPSKRDLADVCTGGGCIGLALAYERPEIRVTAIDRSADALALANENAERLGLSNRFHCLENNLLTGIAGNTFDVVVSNPPYILSDEWTHLDVSVKEFEPRPALDGGRDGLHLIRPLTEQAAGVLRPGGRLFLEIGCRQGRAVLHCLEKAGFRDLELFQDVAGHDRVAAGICG